MCDITNNITLTKYKLQFVWQHKILTSWCKSQNSRQGVVYTLRLSTVMSYSSTLSLYVMGAPGSADRGHLPLALVLGLLAEIALEELHRSTAKPHCSGLALHLANALCFMTWPSSHLGQSERPGCTQPVNNGQPIGNWDIWGWQNCWTLRLTLF